jgi:hypothetical protein
VVITIERRGQTNDHDELSPTRIQTPATLDI